MSEIIENSSETVALQLCQDISATLVLQDRSEDYRKDLLDLYAECLEATKGKRKI